MYRISLKEMKKIKNTFSISKLKLQNTLYSSNMIFVNRVGWDFTILIDSNTHLTTRMYFFVR